MEQQVDPVGFARPFIEQCRREIAAGRMHIEAAREMLKRGRWLPAHWGGERPLSEGTEDARLDSAARSEAARHGMFVGVQVAPRRQRGAVAPIRRRTASHNRLRSASG